jgi:hypothetical protein
MGSKVSNHIASARKINRTGLAEGTVRVETWFMQPTGAETESQTGPEISLQNNRVTPDSGYLAWIAATQYVSTSGWPEPRWYVWTEVGVAPGWTPVGDLQIVPDTWYKADLVADFTAEKYISLEITGGGETMFIDLADIDITSTYKEDVETMSLWISLEAENLFTGCAEVHTSTMFYDDVAVSWEGEVPAPPSFPDADTHIFSKDIKWLATSVIMIGCDVDNFCPDDHVSRHQMATFLPGHWV